MGTYQREKQSENISPIQKSSFKKSAAAKKLWICCDWYEMWPLHFRLDWPPATSVSRAEAPGRALSGPGWAAGLDRGQTASVSGETGPECYIVTICRDNPSCDVMRCDEVVMVIPVVNNKVKILSLRLAWCLSKKSWLEKEFDED